jgi:hypothetical protein
MRKEVVGRLPEDFTKWYFKRANPYTPMHPWVGRTESGDGISLSTTVGLDVKKFCEHREHSIEEDMKVFLLTCEWWLWYLDVLSREEGRMIFLLKFFDERRLTTDAILCKPFRDYLSDIVKQCAHNYCEHDVRFLFVNTPLIFRMVCAVFTVLMTKRQCDKICVLGPQEQASVQAELRQQMGAANLLKQYGGSLEALPGYYPLPTAAEMDEWCKARPFLPVEFPEAPVDGIKCPADSTGSGDEKLPSCVPQGPTLLGHTQNADVVHSGQKLSPPSTVVEI